MTDATSDCGPGYGGTSAEAQLRNTLREWRESLIDQSGRNKLLNFRHTKTSTLELVQPAPAELLTRLGNGWHITHTVERKDDDGVAMPVEADPRLNPGTARATKTSETELRKALRSLDRTSSSFELDRGLWVLYLGLGMLHWADADGKQYDSPLLLYPVRMERSGQGYDYRMVQHAGEEPAFNQSLGLRLEKLGVEQFPLPNLDDLDVDSYFRLVAGAVVGRDGWRVESRAVIAPFSFAKEVMYADLLKNAEALLRHDIVRTLGLSAHVESGVDLGFDPVPEERLDEVAPPETTPLIIDADSSQRRCVQAALDGKPFVMNGPPGTGKTQTIANIIAALMNAGKSVLFVSEKAAALDVAYDRLASVGLGHYVLKLHSHQSTRKAVAQELGKALAFHQKPSTDLSAMERERLRELRAELSAYTAAMNEVRTPLGRSLHDVIGRLAVMPETPSARYAGSDIRALSERDLARIVAAGERAARSWRPVLEGDAFLWRGVTTSRDAILLVGEARNALTALTAALAAHAEIVQPLDLVRFADVGRVLGILETAGSPPPVPHLWLTSDDFNRIEAAVSLFVGTVHRVRQATADAERLAGAKWAAHRAFAEAAPLIVPSLSIRSVDASRLTAEAIGSMVSWLRGMSQTAESLRTTSSRLASLFGMPAPMTAGDVHSLCDLAAIACREHKPEAAWLEPSGLAGARRAVQALAVAAAELARARAAACEVFTPEVLTASNLSATTQRILQAGAVAKIGLSGQHRRDKAYVAALTRSGVFDRGVADALPRALAFQDAQRCFDQTAAEHRTALGGYFAGESTDFALLDGVLRAAEDIAILGRPGDAARIRTLAAKGGRPDPAVATSEARLRDELARWRTVPVEYVDSLDWTAVGLLPLDEASAWCSEQMPALEYAGRVTAAISETAERTLTHAEALQALGAVAAAVEAVDVLAACEAEDRQTLGALYDAERTETENLDRAVTWAKSVRKAAMGDERRPVPPQTAAHLLSGATGTRLAETSAVWESAATAVSGLFDPGCRQEVFADLQREPAAVARVLDALQSDRSGIDQWLNHSEALAELEELGLGTAADWFVASRLTAELFAPACERVALQAWAEDVMASDPRLRRGTADERDDRVATFSELDRRAVEGARSTVVRTIEAAKPLGIGGAAGRIKYEAEKRSRHKPVRDLIAENTDVVLKIKPCFMMSPITVSQFIHPGITFDAVIFDEASQVVPADAINSVYRGRQLIVAGDQKQLPPTAFFSAVDDDDESSDDDENASTAADFASLLDRCVATRFTQLPLRWHYRSRHEGLIAFSNHSFYDDSLVTFPTPYEDLPDYGVKFFKVDGVYRRGSSRDNPKEAAAVAQRVLEHFQTRLGKSIGVVTLSVSQASRIEDELERLRAQRPDLEQHFVQDRNKGLFVKSIENVQGDERDVIVLSVGYGPDENGKLTMAFGPMNSEGGERRLNVAVTRARQLVEVVSSIHGAQIDAGKSASRRHFKRYLEYAESGPAIFTRGLEASVGEPDSPFEESVLSVLKSWGVAAVPQVGVAGYRIDIGIPHPDKPGVFVLGVECDGAMYHSAKTARDRDRLREQVLRGLGWNLHRIWGTAWYRDRRAAEEQLRVAIDRAITAYDEAVSTAAAPQAPFQGGTAAEQPPLDAVELELVEAAKAEDHRTWVVEYEAWQVRPWTSPYEMHLPEARVGIRQIVLEVLQVEAPIHRDVLRDRVRVAWGVGRAGRLIQENFATTLRAMASRGEILLDSEFVDRQGRVTSPVRIHNNTSPRRVDQVPPAERRLAIRELDEESPGMTRDELIERTARLFGWQRLGSDIRTTLENDLDHLIGNGEVGDTHGRHDT